MNKSQIQWCDSTVNPVMGCDGCELYGTPHQTYRIVQETVLKLAGDAGVGQSTLDLIRELVADAESGTVLLRNRDQIAEEIAQDFCRATGITKGVKPALLKAITSQFTCYAASLHRFFNASGKNPGYATTFETPRLYVGRAAITAKLPDLRGQKRLAKPWMRATLPRLIFVSDMGDALSTSVPFDFLKREIVDVANGAAGQRHLWLWLSKRPRRMAEFGNYLATQGEEWPANLVAMTTVTGSKSLGRLEQLRKVPAKFKGVSIEPLREEVTPDLTGIDWAIVGGESGSAGRPFDLRWIDTVERHARRAGAAFFVKQLGSKVNCGGNPIQLLDSHGGDWNEWPEHLKIREFPQAW